MKKIASILLSVVLIFSFTIIAFAQDSSKFDSYLQEKIDQFSDEDKIPVYFFLKDIIDTDELWKKALSDNEIEDEYNTSIDKADACLKDYRSMVKTAYEEYNRLIIGEIGLSSEDVLYAGVADVIIARATKAQIYKAAEIENVISIEYNRGDTFVPTEELDGMFEEQFILDSKATDYYYYDELYYHFDANQKLDWVFIYASAGHMESMSMTGYTIGNVGFNNSSIGSPFICNYGVYDVEFGEFVDLYDIKDDYSKYDGLIEAISGREGDNGIFADASIPAEITSRPGVRFAGDADNDGKLTILDATTIQRCLAKLQGVPNMDYYYAPDVPFDFFHDYDGDGSLSILDATAIQCKLAKYEVFLFGK